MTVRRATCSCGQLTATTEGEPIRISVCHCLACQQRTGSVFGAQARFPRDRVTVAGRATRYVRVADSGNRLIFNFCPDCGATVYYWLEGREDVMAVALGAFADPHFPAPKFSVYEERQHPWVRIQADVEHTA